MNHYFTFFYEETHDKKDVNDSTAWSELQVCNPLEQ
jgi:hypothetical protein